MCTSPQCLHAHTIVIYLSLQDIHVGIMTTPLPQDAADTPRIWPHQERPYCPDLPNISTTMEVAKVAETPHSLQLDTGQENIMNCKIVKAPRNSHTAGNQNCSTRRFQGKTMHILLRYPKHVRPIISVCIQVIFDLEYVIL